VLQASPVCTEPAWCFGMWTIITIVGVALVVSALIRHTGKSAAPRTKRSRDKSRDA